MHKKSSVKTQFFKSAQISFTLYPAHSRVGRGNLVLIHSVRLFPTNSGDIAIGVSELNAAFCLDARAREEIEI